MSIASTAVNMQMGMATLGIRIVFLVILLHREIYGRYLEVK